jgi:hypothetical protein
MENNQITIDDVMEKKQVEQPKKKEPNYFSRMTKLEKEVARLERQIDIIIKSLRR